jgi:uroporphyrinogen-III synthase
MSKHKVLATKKLDRTLAIRAKEKNIELTELELISIRPVSTEEKLKEVQAWAMAGNQNVAFTSAHAVTIVDQFLHPHDTALVTEWKIFCLSGRTRDAVIKAEVLKHEITAQADNARLLAEQIILSGVKEIIFFCGNRRRDDLPDILKKNGVAVREVVVYETIEQPVAVQGDFDGVMFFSPSGVESFFSCNKLPATTVCFAIGETTGQSISRHAANKVITSPVPEPEALLDLAADYLERKKQ